MDAAHLDFRFGLEIVVLLFTVANSIAIWLRKPGQDAKAAVEALSVRFEEQRKEDAKALIVERQSMQIKIQQLEDHLDHMPTDEELAHLRGNIQEVKAVVEGQRDLLKRVEHQQTLILEQLLARSK